MLKALRKWSRATIVPVAMLICGPAWAEGWLCVAEQSAGFHYNKTTKKWESTRLTTSSKFLIRKPTPSLVPIPDYPGKPPDPWVVVEFGKKSPKFLCERKHDYLTDLLNRVELNCKGSPGGKSFLFDGGVLKYMVISPWGYMHRFPADAPTPYMEIGTCTPM